MNKKTFVVAVIFLIGTITWLGVNIYWDITGKLGIFDTVIAAFFVVFAAAMVYNESCKKKRKHLIEVNKHKIP